MDAVNVDGLNTRHAAFSGVLRRVFVPLARILIRQGLQWRAVSEQLKASFLTATCEVLAEKGLPLTEARITITSGLSRLECHAGALRAHAFVESREAIKHDELARLLSMWHLDSEFTLDFLGTPRELTLAPGRGGWDSLATKAAPTQSPNDVLLELATLGAVRIDEERNVVVVVSRAYLPEPYDKASIERLGRMLRNYVETLDTNFKKPARGRGRFERHALADHPLSPEDERSFNEYIRARGQKFLEECDRWIATRKPDMENGRRQGVCLFHYVDEEIGTMHLSSSQHQVDGSDFDKQTKE